MEKMAGTGLRCLAMCMKVMERSDVLFNDMGELLQDNEQQPGFFTGYTFICMCGLKDPVRPEVPAAVNRVQNAGVIVRMVTGDMLTTAKHIARECNILTGKQHICVTRAELNSNMDNLKGKELEEFMSNLRVIARSQPDDKERIVQWYKEHGQTVAVTGDGANDALALKKADIGLAMGIQGTDVAKEASDVVILDDNFNSIVTTLKWGRCVFDNIRKFLQFQLTVNAAAVVLCFIAAFVKESHEPLTPVQMLWINLIMDTFAALALGTERPTPSLLKRRPYKEDCSLISPVMWRFILGHAVYQLIVLVYCLFPEGGKRFLISMMTKDQYESEWCSASLPRNKKRNTDMDKLYFPKMCTKPKEFNCNECEGNAWQCMMFNIFVWFQIFNLLNARKVNAEPNFLDGISESGMYLAVYFGIFVMQIFLIEGVGRMAFDISSTIPLNATQWGWSFTFGALVIPWNILLQLLPVSPNAGQIELDEKKTFAKDLESRTITVIRTA